MTLKEHIFRATVAMIAFAMGIGGVLEYQYLYSFFRSHPVTAKNGPVPQIGGQHRSVFNGSYQLFGDIESHGFKDFRSIDIVTHDYDVKYDEFFQVPLRGSINAAENYVISSSSITPFFSNHYNRTVIRFQTAAINGISYLFIGTINQPNGINSVGESSDFRGELVKLKNGSVIASMEGSFYRTACRTKEKRAHYLCPYGP
jgi:hypothetical protein